MTARHKRFVSEYLVDLNATKAAERTGYSPKCAKVQGSRLLTNVAIQHAIQERMDKRAEKTEITADYVLEGIRDTVAECRAAGIKGATPALKGYELLGKNLKLFTEKVEVSGGLAGMTDEEIQARLEQALGAISPQA